MWINKKEKEMVDVNNKNYILECCVDSVESVINAHNGGANRIELCGNISIGGTTPSLCLFNEVKKNCDIKLHVLIRPRFGDFLYTQYEKQIIKEEVKLFNDYGADGIVVGCLNEEGYLDIEFMKEIVDLSGKMKIVLHRAFDMCKDPFLTIEQCISIGIDTILTSGQQNNCLKGIGLIKELNQSYGDKINIMAGSGMNSDVVIQFLSMTNIRCFHMTGKTIIKSNMKYRNSNVSMGIPSLSEYEIWRTDENEISKVSKILLNKFNDEELNS